MVVELKKHVDAGKVFFGIKENVKNHAKIKKAFLVNDARKETLKMLEEKKIEYDFLDVSKREVSEKLELGFLCEVFGLKK